MIKRKTDGLLFFLFLSFLVHLTTIPAHSSDIPLFEVVAKNRTALVIVVPKETTMKQLEALIFQFRDARKSNSLSRMIPPTTPRGGYGDYAIVWIFVLTDREWASQANFDRFMNVSLKSKSDLEYEKKYARYIKAEYFYSHIEEYGNLGYEIGKTKYGKYKNLF